jgi:hypothetical protein
MKNIQRIMLLLIMGVALLIVELFCPEIKYLNDQKLLRCFLNFQIIYLPQNNFIHR